MEPSTRTAPSMDCWWLRSRSRARSTCPWAARAPTTRSSWTVFPCSMAPWPSPPCWRWPSPCPNQVAEKVASRIAEGFSDTALIMVDNTKFTMDCVVPTIHVYEHHENKWRCRDPHYDYCEDWPEAQRISASLLDSRSYETLVDFDNHLDDIRNDWTNPEINKAVLHLC
uniref:ER membrane protein complex subunit 8 n=1 Tax=Myotis myotis TaxID=51298 RepID=A0A7J7SB31_MYOMY|nr:ER membrane protein complex subunit 8 [Myotis myotis]